MPQRMIGLGAVRINKLVTSYLASGMGAGAVSALSDGWAIMILPQAVIGQAIGTVLFPAISAHAAKGERELFAVSLTRALNVIIALSFPAAVGLVMLSEPLIALLFQRGQFTSTQTQQVAWALSWFATGLLAHAALELVTRAFYATQDSRTPALFSVVSTALNIPLSIGLAALFTWMGLLPFGGLALALSIATALETLALFALLLRRTPQLQLRPVAVELGKSAIACAIMALGIWVWLAIRGDAPLWALLAIGGGAFIYFDAMYLLKSDAAGYVMAMVATLRARGRRGEQR
jgi:putative peptidoglycan lipid II flippase